MNEQEEVFDTATDDVIKNGNDVIIEEEVSDEIESLNEFEKTCHS